MIPVVMDWFWWAVIGWGLALLAFGIGSVYINSLKERIHELETELWVERRLNGRHSKDRK